MSISKGKQYALFVQRQFLVSGEVVDVQSPEEGRDSATLERATVQQERYPVEQKEHILSLKVVIEKTGNDGDEYYFKLCFYDDFDVQLSPYARRSKKASKQVLDIPGERSRRKVEIPMVFRVHKEGHTSLSHSTQLPIQQGIALLYGEIMVEIDRAIRRVLLISEEKKDIPVDERKQPESTRPSEGVRADTPKRRSNTVRNKIRNKGKTKDTSALAEDDGTILGNRPSNWETEF